MHSIYPVCGDNLDDVEGIVSLKDLFVNFEKGDFNLNSNSTFANNGVMVVGQSMNVNTENESVNSGSLTIGSSVTNIGEYAFAGCSGLIISFNIELLSTSIGLGAFYGCTISIDSTVTTINLDKLFI